MKKFRRENNMFLVCKLLKEKIPAVNFISLPQNNE